MGKALEPLTLEHFKRYAHVMRLEDGSQFELEPFQTDFAGDLLARGPDGLPLYPEVWLVVPEDNGKTTLLALLALYHGDYTTDASVPIAAASREQAEIMYRQAEGFVLRTPGMARRFRCYEGYRRIKCLLGGGRIQVYAADDRTADGVIPTLPLVDELHRHRDLSLYRTWRGKISKRGGQIVTISTAGEPGSDFEETRDRIKRQASESEEKGARIRAVSGGVVLHDYALRDRKKAGDMRAVARANPRRAITPKTLRSKRESATMIDSHWLRFVCNIATRIQGQAILPEVWDALELGDYEPPEGCRRWGWIDMAFSIDTTAMGVLFWESHERRWAGDTLVLEPPVKQNDIARGILDRIARWHPEGWVYDPNAGGAQMVQQLEDGEHPIQIREDLPALGDEFFIEHKQDNAPMGLAATRFDEALRAGWFRHSGDRTFRRHALNAVRRGLGGEKWKYDRPPDAQGERRSRFPIDALTGVLMGHSIAYGQMYTDEAPPDDLAKYDMVFA